MYAWIYVCVVKAKYWNRIQCTNTWANQILCRNISVFAMFNILCARLFNQFRIYAVANIATDQTNNDFRWNNLNWNMNAYADNCRCRCSLLVARWTWARVKESYAQMNIFSPQIISFTQSYLGWYTDRGHIEREKESRTTRTTARKQKPTVFIHALYCHCLFFFVFFSLCFHLLNIIFLLCSISKYSFEWLILSLYFSSILQISSRCLVSFFFLLSIDFCLNVFLMWLNLLMLASLSQAYACFNLDLFFASVWIACWTH